MDKPWKVILAFAGIFAAGAICGCLVGLRVARHLSPGSRVILSQNFGNQFMKRFEEQLALTPDQTEKIKPLVLHAQSEVQQLRRGHVKDVTQVMDQLHDQVSALLTPEQRVKHEEMRKRFRERAERIREARGDHPPPAPPS